MTSPLRVSFEVACPAAHAFEVWTSRFGTWWPSDHTVSGDPHALVVLEPKVGGRIYERQVDGIEHEWGEVTRWEPPERLDYRWHLGRAREAATDVEVRFVPLDAGGTRVEIEHHGWERLGEAGADWRDRNRRGWESLLPHFAAAAERGAQ